MADTPRDLARRWFDEIWNERRIETADELLAMNGVGHGEGPDLRGPAGFRAFYKEITDAFPDLRLTLEDIVCEDSKVVVRWRATGTHRATSRKGAKPRGAQHRDAADSRMNGESLIAEARPHESDSR